MHASGPNRNRPILLASTSPQRRAILARLGLPFRALAPAYDEIPLPVGPDDLVRTRAIEKARSVIRSVDDGPVLGVDTAVVAPDGAVLGKPQDAAGARTMITLLAGREHVVLSGLAIVDAGREIVRSTATRVRFRALTPAAVDAYVATGEWRGRAGGYAIQAQGALLVTEVHGCYQNVVGLPVAVLVEVLAEIGYGVLPGRERTTTE